MKDDLFSDFPRGYVGSDADLERLKKEQAPSPKPTADILAQAKQIAASVQPNAWRKYRHLQSTDPVAAGHFWRKEKAAILACRS